MVDWPHDVPKSVRCCEKPTNAVFGDARSVRAPKRVVLEKEREAGENEEKGRSGEAYRRLPCGMALRIEETVNADGDVVVLNVCCRRDAIVTWLMNSGIAGLTGCAGLASSCTALLAATGLGCVVP